jgi:23S rRNA pseudouridine1911/1915/1917 synthase
MTTSRTFWIVEIEQHGLRLDQYLAQTSAEMSRTQARRLIAAGEIWRNGRPLRIASRTVSSGDRITWSPHPPCHNSFDSHSSASSPSHSQTDSYSDIVQAIDWLVVGGRPDFLYRDQYIAIVNKPAGIPSEPTQREDLKTCLRQIEACLREEGLMSRRRYVTAVHRLDAAASGVLAFALRKTAAAHLSAQFANHSAGRLYRAIVAGVITDDQGELQHHLAHVGPGVRQGVVPANRGKLAITKYRVLQRFGNSTVVEIQLFTGRTHQIRVQMAHIGHPLLGDWLYCPPEIAQANPQIHRLMLHAHTLSLQHPVTQQQLHISAPIPAEFESHTD